VHARSQHTVHTHSVRSAAQGSSEDRPLDLAVIPAHNMVDGRLQILHHALCLPAPRALPLHITMANPRPYFEFKMARLWREAGAKGEGGRANGGAKRLSWLLAALLVLLSRQNTEAGIHGLGPLLLKEAPQSASERTLQDFQGKKLAIDASMAMYQFLIAVRVAGRDGVAHTLTTESGEDTSHLQGFFWRTIAMLRVGIKPLYVFDGKPPELKSGELAKRNMRREEGATKLKEAEEMGDVEEMNKFSKRTLRVTRQHAKDCKRLLALMGVPTLDAPCEAEAQCAALCKAGLVYATATDDMDALCCGSPVLVRRLTFSEARKLPVLEYRLDKVLQGLNVTMEEFVDLCILCGCDFAGTIKGVGPKTALNGIRKHHTIELFLKSLNATKHPPPDPFPLDDVRQILMQPEVADPKNISIDWSQPADEPGLISFLVKEKGFSEQRVRNGIEALNKARRTKPQGRLESFFKPATPTPPAGAGKRPGESAGAGAGAGGIGAGAEGGGGGALAADMSTEAEKQAKAETGAKGEKAAAETGNEGGEAHKLGRKEVLEVRDGRKRGLSVALDVDSPSNSSQAHSRKRV